MLNSDTTLCEIAKKYKTDKVQHCYTILYDNLFHQKRNDKLKILEIGVYLGNSIKMWADYFPNATILGIDNGEICPSSVMEGIKTDRIYTEYCDQSNREDLQRIINKYGSDFDIIIDDGSHYQKHQQVSWGFLFPHLKSKGIYIIEDLCLPMTHLKNRNPNDIWGIFDTDRWSDTTWNSVVDLLSCRPVNNYKKGDKDDFNATYMLESEKQYILDNINTTMYGADLCLFCYGSSVVCSMIKK